MQHAKDTFYELLRTRLTAINPERTIVLRGITRPGIVVNDNELPAFAGDKPQLPDCFHLRWTENSVNPDGAFAIATQACEISYETAGVPGNGGMDRGRLLSVMDAELAAAIHTQPRNTSKQNYAALAHGGTATPDGTRIWWGRLELGKTQDLPSGRCKRVTTVDVMSVEKAGEQ